MSRSIELKTLGLSPEGQAEGLHEGRKVLLWGALPGEVVRAQVLRRKQAALLCRVVQVLEPSPYRIQPLEEHYLSCSPWQCLSPDKEPLLKVRLSAEVLQAEASLKPQGLRLQHTGGLFGYRNKMEFSFTQGPEGLSLAFFERSGRKKIPIKGCLLAREEINQKATEILQALRDARVPQEALKSLLVRADSRGRTLAAVFVMDREALRVSPGLQDVFVYYSDPRSPASVPTELLHAPRECFLEEGLLGKPLRVGLLSFFQVNPRVFELTLQDMRPLLEGQQVVELYAGVGSISIALSDVLESALLVEAEPSAVHWARENISLNGLQGRFQVLHAPAERALQALEGARAVLLDPPRAGLHPKVLKKLLQVRPERIVYLSCNIRTLARDLKALLPLYKVNFLGLYNFFPRTPHVEALAGLLRP
jgi:23S rRNA (uracil1939-C5)-methyltransferase